MERKTPTTTEQRLDRLERFAAETSAALNVCSGFRAIDQNAMAMAEIAAEQTALFHEENAEKTDSGVAA